MTKTAKNLASLHEAISANSLLRIKNILEEGGKELLNVKDRRGFVASHCAAVRDVRSDVVAFLVTEGASFDIKNDLGQTARSIASQRIKNFLTKPLEAQKADASLAVSRLAPKKAVAVSLPSVAPKTSSAEAAARAYSSRAATTKVAKPSIPFLEKKKDAPQPKPVTKLTKSSATKVVKRRVLKPIVVKVVKPIATRPEDAAYDFNPPKAVKSPRFQGLNFKKFEAAIEVPPAALEAAPALTEEMLRRDASQKKLIKFYPGLDNKNSAELKDELAASSRLAAARMRHHEESHSKKAKQPASSLKPKAGAKAARTKGVTRPK